ASEHREQESHRLEGRHSASNATHEKRNHGPVRPAPRDAEFTVVGPEPELAVLAGKDREIPIGPVRRVLLIGLQPPEDLAPKSPFVVVLVGADRELVEHSSEPPALDR